MNTKIFALAILMCAFASTAFSAPTLTITPAGIQSGNWVWNIDLTPELALVPDNTGTPVAVELGFRLTGGSLISIANVNPSGFDTSNPGKKIFGWETTFPEDNNNPEGIEANCLSCTISNPVSGGHPTTIVPGNTNEMFVAMGSINFTTPGSKPFLRIVATGPSGGSPSSTLQWLGAYAGNGHIAQISGGSPGGPYTTANYNVSGSATQAVPEPTSFGLMLLGSVAMVARSRRRPACA